MAVYPGGPWQNLWPTEDLAQGREREGDPAQMIRRLLSFLQGPKAAGSRLPAETISWLIKSLQGGLPGVNAAPEDDMVRQYMKSRLGGNSPFQLP